MIGVVELRRYTLKPGARETLVELFDREFVESQEELGMPILGTFRDLDDPDQFVWIRGFEDLAGRAPALQAFYSRPVWKENSAAANATMVDVDNVLLLRPTEGAPSVRHEPGRRPPLGAPERQGLLTVTISPGGSAVPGKPLATYVTEHGENEFPALPVREDVDVVVSLWASEAPRDLPPGTEMLRLRPTPRSLLP
jgi:quinol monooxygenase YgiN